MRRLILNTFAIKLLSAICNLVIAIVVSRYLGTSGKGEQSLILATISMVLIFSNIVGGATIVYLSSRKPFLHIISLSYLWSIFSSLVSFFLLKSLKIVDSNYVIHVVALSYIFSILSINSNILLGKEKVIFSNIINTFPSLLTIISLLIYIKFSNERNANIYINSLYFSFSLTYILSLLFLLGLPKNTTNTEFKGILNSFGLMIRLGFYNQLSHIAGILNARLSFYLLEKYHGTSMLGIYSNGVSISEAVWLISGSMAMVQYSMVSNSNDIVFSQKLSASLSKFGIFISIILIIPLIVLPSAFFEAIFGNDFINTNVVIICLAPGVVFYNYSLILGHYFSGNGKYYINTLISFLGLIVTVFLSLWLIPSLGYIGAGISTSISFIISACFITFFFISESKMNIKEILPLISDIKQYLSKFIKIINYVKNN